MENQHVNPTTSLFARTMVLKVSEPRNMDVPEVLPMHDFDPIGLQIRNVGERWDELKRPL